MPILNYIKIPNFYYAASVLSMWRNSSVSNDPIREATPLHTSLNHEPIPTNDSPYGLESHRDIEYRNSVTGDVYSEKLNNLKQNEALLLADEVHW